MPIIRQIAQLGHPVLRVDTEPVDLGDIHDLVPTFLLPVSHHELR
jgi:hypothetical protein